MNPTWASHHITPSMLAKAHLLASFHWSRVFEYPWVLEQGNFEQGQWVLDAAGGDAPIQIYLEQLGCRVINIDLESPTKRAEGVLRMQGDIKRLPFLDGSFDKIICVSVLEHVDNPPEAINELWRVLAPGGKLLITMDVASYRRWNHTIDRNVAIGILSVFGLTLPPEPEDVMRQGFPEIEPKDGEPEEVMLQVLCFWVEKKKPAYYYTGDIGL